MHEQKKPDVMTSRDAQPTYSSPVELAESTQLCNQPFSSPLSRILPFPSVAPQVVDNLGWRISYRDVVDPLFFLHLPNEKRENGTENGSEAKPEDRRSRPS